MSEVKKIATRESYGNALVELAKEHDDIVVLDADLAVCVFRWKYSRVFRTNRLRRLLQVAHTIIISKSFPEL